MLQSNFSDLSNSQFQVQRLQTGCVPDGHLVESQENYTASLVAPNL